MSLFPALLWKEWRDHRAALLGYFIGVPPLIAWGLSALEAPMRKAPLLPSAAAVCGFAIAALTLFGDLFANEEQRGTIKLLRRLPSGLAKVFIGKISFALLAAMAMSAWAYLATTCASAWLYGGPFLPRVSLPAVAWLSLVFPLAAWISAAAIWLSRATLALPAAALTLALFSAPIGAVLWLNPGMQPMPYELIVAFIALTVAGPFVAGASFVLGRRRSTRAFAPAKAGLLATLFLFTPAYAWTGARVASFLRIEPAETSFRLGGEGGSVGALDTNGRYAYVNAFHVSSERESLGFNDHDADLGDSPLHPICVDLQSGAWREIGSPGSLLFAPHQGATREATPIVGLWLRSTQSGLGLGDPGWRYVDAAAGVAFETKFADELRRRSGSRASAIWRQADSLRLPDGRRVWREGDELVTDDGRTLPDSRFGQSRALMDSLLRGRGFVLDEGVVYDVLNERRVEVDPKVVVWFVRPSRWIVYDRSSVGQGWKLYDPESRERSDVAGLGKLDFAMSLWVDGRLLVVTKEGKAADAERELVLLDPESGARESVGLPPTVELKSTWVQFAGRTPSGREIVWVHRPNTRQTLFLRLDAPSTNSPEGGVRVVTTAPLSEAQLLGASDEESVVVIESSRRLVRLRFDGSPPELLFPR